MCLLGTGYESRTTFVFAHTATNFVLVACGCICLLESLPVICKGRPHLLVACGIEPHAAITDILVACAFSIH
jgi:hypothetical protein